jgi:hypothetical protein
MFLFKPCCIEAKQIASIRSSETAFYFFGRNSRTGDDSQPSNCFIDLNGFIHLTNSSDDSMTSDIFMLVPNCSYSKATPFCVPDLKKGECYITINAMNEHGVNVGDNVFVSRHETSEKVIGYSSPMKGFENEHTGIAIIGYDQELFSEWVAEGSTKYICFLDENDEPGDANPTGNLISAKTMTEKSETIIRNNSLIYSGGYLLVFVLSNLLLFRIRKNDCKALIREGGNGRSVFASSLLFDSIENILPVIIVFSAFLIVNRLYLIQGLYFALGALVLSLVCSILHSLVISWRSSK